MVRLEVLGLMFCVFCAITNVVGELITDMRFANSTRITDSETNNMEDSPEISDLLPLIKSFWAILEFASSNMVEIDVTFAYALSISHDNLKHIVLNRGPKLRGDLKVYIREFLQTHIKILQYFESRVKEIDKEENNAEKRLCTTLLSTTFGVTGISEFNKRRRPPLNRYRSTSKRWGRYKNKVDNIHSLRWRPNPRDNDQCLLTLAKTRSNASDCQFANKCKHMLINGTDFGHPLTHRLIWLLQAKRARGCHIMSKAGDQDLIDGFCTMIFYESAFIAANRYEMLELLLEQMTFCSLAGYADALRRSWMKETLKHQTQFGCYSNVLPPPKELPQGYEEIPHQWVFLAFDDYMLAGICNRRLTAFAAAAISSVIRYVLEEKLFT